MPHTEVEFEVEGDRAVLRRAESELGESRGPRLVRRLRGRASVALTTDEIMALTRSDD